MRAKYLLLPLLLLPALGGCTSSSGNGYTRFRTFNGRTMYVRTKAIALE